VRVFEPEVEKLIRLKYLEPHERQDLKAVQDAAEAFFNTDNHPTGAGQMATPLVAPAINNAFAALTGKRLRETPMTPERVKESLG